MPAPRHASTRPASPAAYTSTPSQPRGASTPAGGRAPHHRITAESIGCDPRRGSWPKAFRACDSETFEPLVRGGKSDSLEACCRCCDAHCGRNPQLLLLPPSAMGPVLLSKAEARLALLPAAGAVLLPSSALLVGECAEVGVSGSARRCDAPSLRGVEPRCCRSDARVSPCARGTDGILARLPLAGCLVCAEIRCRW